MICRAFAPDSVVGAKRMAMLAKHLSKIDGNTVTVIRSGLIFGKPDDFSILKQSDKLSIISYEGKDSPAERYEAGERSEKVMNGNVNVKTTKERSKLYITARNAYRFIQY